VFRRIKPIYINNSISSHIGVYARLDRESKQNIDPKHNGQVQVIVELSGPNCRVRQYQDNLHAHLDECRVVLLDSYVLFF
jgi:hypothetical protein